MIKDIHKELFLLQDLSYRDFHAKLMPTVDKEKIIGIRTPELRKYATSFAKDKRAEAFLSALPHEYYEENNLHGFLIQKIKSFDECVTELDRFLPFVDNWATCDMMSPKVLKKEPEKLLNKIKEWLSSEHAYTVRFGVKCLMDFYLDDNFSEYVIELVSKVRHEDYYVKMVCAWFFATALAKQYDSTLPYITEKKLEKQIHNKAIQKAVESYRISDDTKEYLKKLKIKEK
ncbi:MAG: DNA alkylation repair protein [Clostridia bacterium]|nr:DNA alkylation repair protein [Clostridia bacterium]